MKISIITVCKNSESSIEQTIQSVLNQTFKDFEYIIVDGQSTDRTLEIIDKYNYGISKYVSEPDKGIYDAMNKGIEIASGDYIMFLNSDDVLFHDNVLKLVSQEIDKRNADLYFGDLIFLEKHNGHFNNRKQNSINYVYICGGMLFHPTIFAQKSLFEKIGKFDTGYKIVADYEWILRALVKYKSSCEHLGFTTTVFSQGKGISCNSAYKELHKKERFEAQRRYFSNLECVIYNFLYKSMRSMLRLPIIKQILSKIFLMGR